MVHERYDPLFHADPLAYYDTGGSQVEKNRRMHSVLNFVFTNLARTFNYEVREFTYQEFAGNYSDLFAAIPLEGREPVREDADQHYRQWLRIAQQRDSVIEIPHYDELYMSRQRRITIPKKGGGPISIFSPVGEYGPELSIAVVQAARSMYGLVNIIREECDEVNKKYRSVLRSGTFFEDANLIMREAAGTTAATFSLLALRKDERYNDPLKLFEKLLDKNIFSPVGTISPFGLIIPMSLHGIAIPGGLDVDDSGDISLSEQAVEFFLEERRLRGQGKGSIGQTFGCPAAPDGIRYVAEIFYKALKYHYNNPTVVPEIPQTILFPDSGTN